MAGMIITVLVITVLVTAAFFWLDPLARIGTAKDERRRGDVNLISRAISDYVKDNKGALPVLGAVTTDKKTLCKEQGGTSLSCGGDSQVCIRIADPDFYSNYLGDLPLDPDKTANTDTGYYLQKDSDGNLVVGACSTYGSGTITATSGVKVTCDGYAGGYCWVADDADSHDCDTACSDVGLTCVSGVTYGPDTNSGGSDYCALNLALGGTCDDCYTAASGDAPSISDDGVDCYIQTEVVPCDDVSDSFKFPVCPCE